MILDSFFLILRNAGASRAVFILNIYNTNGLYHCIECKAQIFVYRFALLGNKAEFIPGVTSGTEGKENLNVRLIEEERSVDAVARLEWQGRRCVQE